MSAPHITSTTTMGLSLPGLSITKDFGEVQPVVNRRLVVKEVKRQTAQLSLRARLKTGVPLFLILANIALFGSYLYNVNNTQALSYNVQQSQKELRSVQDKHRQLQVVMAEQAAMQRARDQVHQSSEFVVVGTPEFIAAKSGALTMR